MFIGDFVQLLYGYCQIKNKPKKGVMDKIHAGVGSNAIYCLYLQGIKAMNQKTALFVMINTPRRMDAS